MDIEMLRERSRIISRVRAFFDGAGYLELDTPVLSPDLIPESCLEVFETRRISPGKAGSRPRWLVPSPEIWMKKIIARHRVSVYQVCKCFRNGESLGRLHSGEFTMLEYYTMDAGYLDSLVLTESLFEFLASGPNPQGGRFGEDSLPGPPFERITVADAFSRYAGFDLFEAADSPLAFEEAARRLGLDPVPGMDIPALYDLVFVHAVEPRLDRERPVALMDYPAFVPCLARRRPDNRTVERWELYYKGIELANCYSEEQDGGQVRAFFEAEAGAKEKNALVRHDVDHDYWKIFAGFPRCSGVALGLDRLIMAMTGRTSIDSVLPFPEG